MTEWQFAAFCWLEFWRAVRRLSAKLCKFAERRIYSVLTLESK